MTHTFRTDTYLPSLILRLEKRSFLYFWTVWKRATPLNKTSPLWLMGWILLLFLISSCSCIPYRLIDYSSLFKNGTKRFVNKATAQSRRPFILIWFILVPDWFVYLAMNAMFVYMVLCITPDSRTSYMLILGTSP